MNETRSRPRAARRVLVALIVGSLAAVLLVGCGGSSSSNATSATSSSTRPATALPRMTSVTLILDFIPNAVHAGIYRAIAAGYYKAQNIDLRVIEPTSTADTLKLIDAGKANFGLADGSDVAGQIAAGRDAQAIMAIAQRPLGGLIGLASEHLTSPAELQGRTVGVTGVPSDTATLDTEVRDAGGDPAKVHVVGVGFDGAQDLQAGKIAAFTGFWPDDGVALQVSGHPITTFKLDDYGGPPYPGLVAFTTRRVIASDPALVRAFTAATVAGYEDTVKDPSRSLAELLHANPTLQRTLTAAALRAYLPLFTEGGKVAFGTLRPTNLAALSSWMLRTSLIKRAVSPTEYGTDRFLPGG